MKLEDLNPNDYELVLFNEMSNECCEKCAFYKLTLDENGGECPSSADVKEFCCVSPNGYFVLRAHQNASCTRPTSTDPSRKPWIEPLKVGDKVLIEGVVNKFYPDGCARVKVIVDETDADAYIYVSIAPHQLKLSTNVQPGEK